MEIKEKNEDARKGKKGEGRKVYRSKGRKKWGEKEERERERDGKNWKDRPKGEIQVESKRC